MSIPVLPPLIFEDTVAEGEEAKDFYVDWGPYLAAQVPLILADTIATSSWSTPTNATVGTKGNDTTHTWFWVSNPTTALDNIQMKNTITTAGGRTYTLPVQINISQH